MSEETDRIAMKYKTDPNKPRFQKNILNYGNFGVGKTYMLRSLKQIIEQLYPDRPKVLVLGTDDGQSCLNGCLDWIDVEDYSCAPQDAVQVSWDLVKRINGLADECPYGAVVLDTFSGYQGLIFDRVLIIAAEARQKLQGTALEGKVKTGDAYQKGSAATDFTQRNPDERDYGQVINILEDTVTTLTAIKAITIVNAHEMVFTTEIDKHKMIGGPFCVGKKFPARLGGFFDEIWRITVRGYSGKEPDYAVTTMPDSTFYARSRMVDKNGDRILAREEVPSYEEIYRKGGYIK